jgi:glycerate-2-kinase
VLDAALQGDAEAFARTLPRLVAQARAGTGGLSAPCCLIWAGELTVEVRGAGTGGRNQQLALAFALACEGDARVALAALATDGVDGPSGAAGAIVDGASAAKMRAAGIDPARALRENDSFPALAAAGALVQTGASGTNVNDLFLLYVA